MQPGNGSSSKIDRKQVERNRRMHMKNLASTLASHILPQASKDKPPLHVLLDQATTYVKHSRERIQELKRRKERLVKGDENRIQDKTTGGGSIAPVINFRILDSTLEVNFISGLDKNFLLHEVIKVLEEEGAEVFTVSYSTVGDRVAYTIHSQAIISRIGIETSRVQEKLKKIVL